ncbi:MAG: tetratricopeptide repeat protein [Draconibacterium sp.]|nr:tetratricopeptide repeat protein [Draconibacterium sp.]
MTQFFNKIRNYTTIIFVIAISVSCITTKTLTIEIPQQSKNELPQSIQSLTLVNRTVDSSFSNLDTDSLQKLFYLQNFNYDTIINDIQASDTTLKALGELLFESGRYDFVIPENRFLEFNRNLFLNEEMPWNEVKEICDIYNTDAVLSLDYFRTLVSTDYRKESFYDAGRDGFAWASFAEMKISYEALFRVYDPVQEKVIIREFIRDTVIWEDVAGTTSELFEPFTPVKTALSEVGIAIALDFSDKISTTWHRSYRKLFVSGDENIKNAAPFAENNEWETAMALWKETLENTSSKTVKSRAEFNIAVAYELQGEIDEAIAWALKSYETMYRQITYDYLEILKRRKYTLKRQSR